jgi:DNA-binding transcriptional LysR family regulator
MTLHQLKIFLVVSRYCNITKASKVLRISQPSVFKQVKSLEESYKTKLYKKVGRGIELTEQGQLFQREVEEKFSVGSIAWIRTSACALRHVRLVGC